MYINEYFQLPLQCTKKSNLFVITNKIVPMTNMKKIYVQNIIVVMAEIIKSHISPTA